MAGGRGVSRSGRVSKTPAPHERNGRGITFDAIPPPIPRAMGTREGVA